MLARTSWTMLKYELWECMSLFFSPVLIIQSFPIKYDVSKGFLVDVHLSSWGSFPLFLVFWEFLWISVELCPMFFLHQLIWSCDFSSLIKNMLICWITLIDFWILNQLYIPGSKLHLVLLWAFLIAQLVKNLSAMQETPVRFLGLEDPLEKG